MALKIILVKESSSVHSYYYMFNWHEHYEDESIVCKNEWKMQFQKWFNKCDQQIKWQMIVRLEKQKAVHTGKISRGTNNSIKKKKKSNKLENSTWTHGI